MQHEMYAKAARICLENKSSDTLVSFAAMCLNAFQQNDWNSVTFTDLFADPG